MDPVCELLRMSVKIYLRGGTSGYALIMTMVRARNTVLSHLQITFWDEGHFPADMGPETTFPKPTFDSLYAGIGEELPLQLCRVVDSPITEGTDSNSQVSRLQLTGPPRGV
jgi:hypothetical protein